MNNRLACVALSSLLVACSSSTPSRSGSLDASPGSDARSSRPDATTDSACTSDSQCATFLANLSPTPAGCAEAYCDTSLSRCAVRPVDHDKDTYPTAACSVPGVSFTPGTDCNDNDPNLYPGHPESCDTGPDGGPPPAGFCAGQLKCLADGTESPCTGTTCINQACVAGACTGQCSPGQVECSGIAGDETVRTCSATGTWGQAASACAGNQPEKCSGGELSPVGAPCSGETPVCYEGACVACVPGTLACSGAQPVLCSAPDGGAPLWVNDGNACSGAAPGCSNGGCIACPGQTAVNGVCTGVCAPGMSQCAGTLVVTCGASGEWNAAAVCEGAAPCCGTECAGTNDRNNCGGCGYVCSGPCVLEGCDVTLATGQNTPTAIAVDATSVYWLDGFSSATVMKVALGGGTPVTLVSGQPEVVAIAVDATSVYWNSAENGTVMKVALGGGTPVTLASGRAGPYLIAVDATSAYWTDYLDNTVMKVALGGGTPVTLASGQANAGGIAVDATSVYWTSADTVMKVALGGGTPVTLASGQVGASSLAVDNTSAYWTNSSGSGTVVKVAVGGGTPVTLASGQPEPGHIALDATNVYWAVQATLIKVALGGGAPVTLIPGQLADPTGVAVDATSVYWTQFGAQPENPASVMKVTPK